MNNVKFIIKYIVYSFFVIFPIKKNKIVCNNFMGKGFGDNPKYIVNELINQKTNCDIVWVCKPEYARSLPSSVRIATKWYEILYEFATAKIWISNVRLPRYLRKRKGQFYIQTWHGGLGFKKVEKDVVDSLSRGYVKDAIHDARQTDLMIANCKFLENLYKDSFWYDGYVLCEGLPKNDCLTKSTPEKDNEILSKYNLHGFDIILYAPTFRKKMDKEVYNINFNSLIKLLNKKTNKKWKVIVRLHPNVNFPENYIDFNNDIINVSDYDDINDLYSISDMLISDYSSIMFDFMLTNKPVFIYATDIEEYKKDRDFYLSIEELPFSISTNNKELLKNVEKNDLKKLMYKYNKFNKKYGIINTGDSSKKIVKIIEEKLG